MQERNEEEPVFLMNSFKARKPEENYLILEVILGQIKVVKGFELLEIQWKKNEIEGEYDDAVVVIASFQCLHGFLWRLLMEKSDEDCRENSCMEWFERERERERWEIFGSDFSVMAPTEFCYEVV